MKKIITGFILVLTTITTYGQDQTNTYKKRVLENTEVDILSSFYMQSGDNAATTGGIGTEEILDGTATIIVSIPLNDDDILKIDAGISAYTSASSSNINPFTKPGAAVDPYTASSGASNQDIWRNLTLAYTHSSDDRNNIYNAKVSVSGEYDYFSFGFGGGFTKLFNEKNTELSINTNIYLDKWELLYPVELRTPEMDDDKDGDDDEDDFDISLFTVEGAPYNPNKFFTEITDKNRSSYSLNFGFSQILSKRLQTSFALDLVKQEGLLSTPFHRIYFEDVANSYIENFQLADDIERLPDTRYKIAFGNRFSYYINEFLIIKTYYRYYSDDWGIESHTASIELPIKITQKFTLYPSYRYYNQTAADYFAGYEQHSYKDNFYTSDYDLSEFNANQFAFGVSYTDIFTERKIWKMGLKSIDLKFVQYDRNSSFKASMVTLGAKFIIE